MEPHRSVSAPLRVGLAGLTRTGLFHLESFALRREFALVAVAGTETTGSGNCHMVPLEELVGMDLDLAVIATPVEMRACVAGEFLSAGTSVLIESGFDTSGTQALEEGLRLALTKGLFCGLWQPELCEPDYLAANSVTAGGVSGEVRSARLLQHNLTAGPDVRELPGSSDERRQATGALAVARRRVTQLLNLCEGPVSSARIEVRHDAGPLSAIRSDGGSAETSESPVETAVTLYVQFASGATALIDVDVVSSSSVNTGWILQTLSGGYHDGHRSQLEMDGEVYAVPCESSDADAYTRLAEILNSSASVRRQESERSGQSEVKTARLLDFAWSRDRQ